jgi:hypothetical protein
MGTSVGAEYMFEGSSLLGQSISTAVPGQTGVGNPFQPTRRSFFPIRGSILMFDQAGIGSPTALNCRFQTEDANYNVLYTSYVYPLSLSNTGMVCDIINHQ